MGRLNTWYLGMGVLVAVLSAYWLFFQYNPNIIPEDIPKRVYELKLDSLVVQLEDADGRKTETISASAPLPSSISVQGSYSGLTPYEFDRYVMINQQFAMSIQNTAGLGRPLWNASPGKIELEGGNRFRFRSRFMLSHRVKPGEYVLIVTYADRQLHAQKLQVVK